mmetsp:Transcript_42702/g.102979  ORF Transcript_42702/g.102979 Transcript_42702/m.102979 type:complete len:988 (-) Transcript_42702:1188-4151(-)
MANNHNNLDQSYDDESMLRFAGNIEDIVQRNSSESASSADSSAEMFRTTLKKNLSARFEDEVASTTTSNTTIAASKKSNNNNNNNDTFTAVTRATSSMSGFVTATSGGGGSTVSSWQDSKSTVNYNHEGRTKMNHPFQICTSSTVKGVPAKPEPVATAAAIGLGSLRPPLHTQNSSTVLQTAQQPQQQLGMIAKNRFSVLLRIRPLSSSSMAVGAAAASNKHREELKAAAATNVNTIEILESHGSNSNTALLPTKIRTYPPTLSNSIRINVNRQHTNGAANSTSTYAKEFEFDGVLGPDSSQQNCYSAVAAPLIDQVLQSGCSSAGGRQRVGGGPSKSSSQQNESALIFSYGITNAGKTHTILGDIESKTSANWGIIPRALSHVLDHIRGSATNSQQQPPAELYMSFFEIYNEQVYDLVPAGQTSTSNTVNSNFPEALKVRECRGQVLVRGLNRHKISSTNQGIALSKLAHKKRHTSSNNLNKDSSRSHFICQMQIVNRRPMARAAAGENVSVSSSTMGGYTTDEEVSVHSKQQTNSIWIVDLAGSERSKRTNVISSSRQKESIQINQSLMTLMICLNGINENGKSGSNSIIPYRNSKLTHIFQSHLTSMSAWRTAMIVNVNPAVADFDETQHVLAYARTAKLIKLKPEEFGKKRKQYFGGDTYDLNGRKKVRPEAAAKPHASSRIHPAERNSNKTTMKGFVSRIVEKLSPKRTKSSNALDSNQKSQAMISIHGPSKKNLNLPGYLSSSEPQIESTAVSSTQQSSQNVEDHNAFVDLRISFEKAQEEISRLEAENDHLRDSMAMKEEQIRSEVAEEMEDMLRLAREKHKKRESELMAENEELKKSNTSQMIKKDRAENELDELLDKYIESESEMVRMNNSHKEEISSKDAKIKELQRALQQAMNEKEEVESRKANKDQENLAASSKNTKRSRNEDDVDDAENEENESDEPLSFNSFKTKKNGSTMKDRLRKNRRNRAPLGTATNARC